MLRFKILVSIVPLILAILLARIEPNPGPHPGIAAGHETLQIGTSPRQAGLHANFTDAPVVDDDGGPGDNVCELATQVVAIATKTSRPAPVIYLSHDSPADDRIFVKSRSYTAREDAALIVSMRHAHRRLASVSL